MLAKAGGDPSPKDGSPDDFCGLSFDGSKSKGAKPEFVPGKLTLKLADGVDVAEAVKAISALPGVESVVQTFGGISDPELDPWYTIKVQVGREAELMNHLLGDSRVDACYREPARTLPPRP